IPDEPLHRLFERCVDEAPAAVAVRDASRALDYAGLDSAANRLANHLATLGVTRGYAVGMCLDRSVDMVVALLAILKAGGAYLPLNYEHPPARVAHQLAQAGATVAVGQEAHASALSSFEGETVYLDRDEGA